MALVTTASTHVKAISTWQNYHTTISDRSIPYFCTVLGADMRTHGTSLKEILGYCFQNGVRVRALGGRWSLSPINTPEDVTIDTANMEQVNRISADWLTADYLASRRPGFEPMIVQGGATIASIHRRFASQGLAMRTSGASDGQRIAGAIATGTHGAAIDIGAMHDTVLGMHIVVAPDRAVFIQPSKHACKDDVGRWLGTSLGIATENIADDDVFHAVIVSLGAMGFVHAVVLEAEPLYVLRRTIGWTKWESPDVWATLEKLQPTGIAKPCHIQALFNPYPDDPEPVFDYKSAYTIVMERIPCPNGIPPPTTPITPVFNSDAMSFVGHLLDEAPTYLDRLVIRPLIRNQIEKIWPKGVEERFPGTMFGPCTLPAGPGNSTEIFVDHANARRALHVLKDQLDKRSHEDGWHHAGLISARVMAGTRAHLGMNQWPLSCAIELPGIRTEYVNKLQRNLYLALSNASIPFVCHWGQEHRMERYQLDAVYGSKVEAWRSARRGLLDQKGLYVFGCDHLHHLGLC